MAKYYTCVQIAGYNSRDTGVVVWLQSCESNALMLSWAELKGSVLVTGDTKQASMMLMQPQSYGLMQFIQ